MSNIVDELFLKEQLLQKEMALEQEHKSKAQLIKMHTQEITQPVEKLIQFANFALLRMQRKEFSKASSHLAEMKLLAEDLLMHLKDLQEIALLRSGESKFSIQEVRIKCLLSQLQMKFQSVAENAQVHLSFHLNPKELYAIGDEHKLMKVISIILSKLMTKARSGERIEIKASEQQSKVKISILDHNTFEFEPLTEDGLNFDFFNISEKDIFPTFNLEVCRELIEAQRGFFNIVTEDNKTEFIIMLPKLKDMACI